MRDGKDQVGVRHRQQFTMALGDPGFLGARLALRAMAVAARVIDMPGGAACVALFDGRQQVERRAGLGKLFLEVEIAGGGGDVVKIKSLFRLFIDSDWR